MKIYKVGGAVDLEPIVYLYKTEVFEMAKYLKIPEQIINRPPTAGLFSGQTDEKEIGVKYEEIDRILKLIKEGRISSYIEEGNVQKVLKRINSNKHKSAPIPICKLDE